MSRLSDAAARRAAEAAATMPAFTCAQAAPPMTPDALLERLAGALAGSPLNGAWRDGAAQLHEQVRLAVALPGPVSPVWSGSFAALAERDPESFTAAELAGATFTISGLGLELDWLTPLLVPRQAAGLGVGRAGLILVCDARMLAAADGAALLSALTT